MKCRCLVHGEERDLDAVARVELDALVGEPLAYDGELRASGHVIVAEAFESSRAATTVRVRNGEEHRRRTVPRQRSSCQVPRGT